MPNGGGGLMTNEWLEKELEDYIAADPVRFCEVMYPPGLFEISLLGRQVRCQFGIIDVLLWVRNVRFSYVVIVECKAKYEKGLAVEQVTRYQSAVETTDIYSNTPSDAWPIYGTDYHGWARYIELETVPVIVAPSFDEKLLPAFSGALITAQKTPAGFVLERVGGRPYPDQPDQLNLALAPAIRRAHIDAKSREMLDALRSGIPGLNE